ncbi:restriction endonuclease subunit S [Thiothrix lacustris]|uniref:restriction endonuclease subunit S n=1 Tax=Thiothrix lacustris TaxID=525917 RepID=UPI0027E4A5D7|nr:restriction endonuclease subunit S [Thiothrix lacustris]WMP17368.1 restriction endonuclease subunit S [Thiothrix lacustris]
MSWHQIELGSALHVKHGFAFKGEFFSSAGEYMVLTPGNFLEEGGFRVRDGKERFYHGDIPEAYILEENDLIIAMTEQGEGLLGSTARVPESKKYLHNQRLGLVQRIDKSKLDTGFLYWLLNSSSVRGQIRSSATGAKVKHTAPERIYKVKVQIPVEVAEQAQIAQFLDAYDDLIAANQRHIQLLEESARLLYREWFIKLRFPNHEQTKIIDGIPEGWSKQPFDALAEIVMGQSPKSEFYNEDGQGLPFHQGVTQFGERFVTDTIFTTEYSRESEAGDILCSVRAPVGRLNITCNKIAIGRGLSAMRSRFGWQSLLFYQLKDYFVQEDMIGGGAIFASVSKKELFSQELLQPTDEVADSFDRFAKQFDEQIEALARQNVRLRQARDALLPKLMSGELRV